MIKSIMLHQYTKHLQKKWHMTSSGAHILVGSFYKDYKEYAKNGNSYAKIWNAHRNGFSISDWKIMELDNEKCKEYISNAQYYAKHPYNGKYGKWIDDKMTLKYICSGTVLDRYMPKYYFMIDEKGLVMKLMDCPESVQNKDIDGILRLLEEKGILAAKRISGSMGEGFYRIEWRNGKYILNGMEKTLEEIKKQLSELHNYLIIEYLYPHSQFAEYCPNTCACLRYLVGRINGELYFFKGYIRFGAKQSGFIDNYNAGGVLCYVDKNGFYSGGNIMDIQTGKNIKILEHPDSKKKLEGQIPLWDEVQQMVKEIDHLFPQLSYLGIDVVITSDNQVKMLEINSLTSLDGLQLLEPIKDKKILEFIMK